MTTTAPRRPGGRPGARTLVILVALAAVLTVVAGLLTLDRWSPDARPAPAAVVPPASTTAAPPAAPSAPPDPCARPSAAGFVPRFLSVEGVVRRAPVRGVPRDAAGVPGVLPSADKHAVAWDLGGVEPGTRRGHVLLNTHTWPDGSALGNRLLDGLAEGGMLRLGGPGGALACYEVVERVEVREEDGYPGWDRADGAPRVVIVVCSGERLGPGRWTHRTLWFARPVRGAAA